MPSAGSLAVLALLSLLCVVWLIPLAGVLVSSLRTAEAVFSSGWWTALLDFFQEEWTLANYRRALDDDGFGMAFVNSIVITVPTVILTTTVALFAAYGFAWTRFRGRDAIFLLIVALLVVPLQVAFIPLLRLYNVIGISFTWEAIWLTHTMFGIPIALFILANFVRGIPRDLIEAARADGASHWDTFLRVVVPLATPAIAAFAVFQFLWVWNDMLVALVFLGADPEHRPVTVALQLLTGNRGQEWHVLTAGAFISMIIPVLVFLTLQRYLVRGLTAGAVK
jgi:alpha-glucoside transport system permease protein